MSEFSDAIRAALVAKGWTTNPESTGYRFMQPVAVGVVADVAAEAVVEAMRDRLKASLKHWETPQQMRERDARGEA